MQGVTIEIDQEGESARAHQLPLHDEDDAQDRQHRDQVSDPLLTEQWPLTHTT